MTEIYFLAVLEASSRCQWICLFWALTPWFADGHLLPVNSHGYPYICVVCILISSYKDISHIRWRRQWHPTPVLLPGKSHGWRSLVGCSPWGHWGSDMTERLHFHFSLFMHWRGKWQPTPVFLPGESQGWGSLVGCRLWGHTESDMTEVT